jgi:hypothetical protein
MSRQVRLPGRELSPANEEAREEKLNQLLGVKILAASEVDLRTRGGAERKTEAVESDDNDVIEMELEDGTLRWWTVGELRREQGAPPAPSKRGRGKAGAEPEVFDIPASLPRGGETRGVLGDLAAKVIKLFQPDDAGIDAIIAEHGPDLAARYIAEYLEKKLEAQINPGGVGLYRFESPKWMEGKLQDQDLIDRRNLDNKAPYLIFLHGTASSSLGSFGGLGVRHGFDQLGIETTPEWEELRTLYRERMLAYEHRTLSRSPLENAIDLATVLPKGARIHLVSHSRGGLIGELLCLGEAKEIKQSKEFSERLLKPFPEKERAEDRENIKKLVSLLAEKQLLIERFVRVACPARGTTLASRKINEFFSGVFNLMKYLPWMKTYPALDFIRSTVIALLKYADDPSKLPGIEAMVPESPFIRMLNGLDLTTRSDLAVIEGDIQPGEIFERLKLLPIELLFREDHDLVVNTRAMTGGMKREQGAVKFFDQGQEVSHFSYFRNQKTRLRLIGWLKSDKADDDRVSKAGFVPMDAAVERGPISRGSRAIRSGGKPVEKAVVFVLPDFMGSQLDISEGRVWPKLSSIARGDFKKLEIDRPDVVADELVGSVYGDLTAYLQASHDVIPFAYDWRRSFRGAADELKAAVSLELTKHKQPIRFLTHGAGALVVRLMIARNQELWSQLKKRDSRLVMLGAPSRGMYFALQMLCGQAKWLDLTALIDLENEKEELVQILRQYPGLVELSPLEYLDASAWKGLKGIKAPEAGLLREAKALRAALEKAVDPDRMIYAAGVAPLTAAAMAAGSGAPVFRGVGEGDGRVTYASGLLDGIRTWKVNATHGELASHKASFPAYVELLEKGATGRLVVMTPPATTGEPTLTTIREEPPQMYPDEADLLASALGAPIGPAVRLDSKAIKVSVYHSDLRQARFPIAVGHYEGFPIIGAEKAIDRALGYRLTQLLQAGLYPDAVGRAEVIRMKGAKLKGALVVGLGEFGNVTLQEVRRGVTAAALRYAMSLLNDPAAKAEKGWASASFSTLLLGSYSSNNMGVTESVDAILQGAIMANRVLEAQKLWEDVRIEEVEFIELYDDVASQAIRAAARFVERPPAEIAADEIPVLEPGYLQSHNSGQPQRPPDQYGSGGWVRQVRVVAEDPPAGLENRAPENKANDGSLIEGSETRLVFTVATDRANAPESVLSTQRKIVDGFVRKAVVSSRYNSSVGTTLFELLIPNVFKDHIGSEGDMLLELDAASAQYPWEMLAHRKRDDVRPIVIDRGLIRRLATREFRVDPQIAQGSDALVIGDPLLTGTSFQPLDGAEAEARLVTEMLKARSLDVTSLIRKDALQIVGEIFQRDYRIIHLAGHGYYDPKNPIQSGMALAEGQYLSAAVIGQLRVIPDLVFINCCSLGQIDETSEPHKLAASISLELIQMGVKAVVAAGWEVDDEAAMAFAETFYGELLGNARFIDAVKDARNRIRKDFPGTNTWGAYQCYGDPEFRLKLLSQQDGGSVEDAVFYSSREYLDELTRLAVQARRADGETKNKLRLRIASLRDAIPNHMLTSDMLALLGDVWGELEEFEECFRCYDRASNSEKPTVTIWQLQQYANFLGRYARKLHHAAVDQEQPKGKPGKRQAEKDPARFLDRERHILNTLIELGTKTAELYSLLGSHYKRRAQILDAGKRIESLRLAAEEYQKAAEIKRSTGADAGDLYAAINWITCKALLTLLDRRLRSNRRAYRKQLEAFLPTLESLEAQAAKLNDDEDIWKRLHQPDLMTLRCVLTSSFDDDAKESLIDAYRSALKDGSSPRNIGSVTGQLDFLWEMLSDDDRSPKNQIQFLESVRDAVARLL